MLTGGTGGAKFVDGLRQIVPAKDLTIIVNTGDDLEWWGLYVSPDLDSITYVLAGLLSKERGWGVKGDTFFCLQAMGELGEPIWFHAGDRDLAVHLLRTKLLKEGKTLTEVAAAIAAKMGVQARILPMCDARIETRVDTPIGDLSFEEYFVQRWYQDPVNSVRFAGAEKAEPAPGVIDAIMSATVVLLAPSNPITSIGPILAVPGIMDALKQTNAPIAAVSPIVGAKSVSGPAGYSDGRTGPARFHRRRGPSLSKIFWISWWSIIRDAKAAEDLRKSGLRVHCANTVMSTITEKADLARQVLSLFSAQGFSARSSAESSAAHRRLGCSMILVPVKNLAAPSNASPPFSINQLGRNSPRSCCWIFSRLWQIGRIIPTSASSPATPSRFSSLNQFHFTVIADHANRGETDAIETATRFCEIARDSKHPGHSRRHSA